MRVSLVSEDVRLAAQIQSWLPENSPPVNGPASGADVAVWDMPALESLPASLPCARHIFLLEECDLPGFHRRFPGAAAAVLLKPVDPPLLRRALQDALRSADRDLLQCLLLASWRLQEHHHERVNFLARTVHELLAPLTAACGYCGILADKCLGHVEPVQVETMRRIERSLQRASQSASAAFEISVGRADIPESAIQPASIEDCVETAAQEVAPAAEAKSLEIISRLGVQPEGLRFDSAQMTHVFMNLLENACRFAPRNGTVTVTGCAAIRTGRGWAIASPDTAQAYRVDVSDNGPGIPAGHEAEIFSEYISYPGGDDRAGSGLSLAICRLIVQAHGGEIFADSREDGATFSVVIPAVPPQGRGNG